MCFGFAKAQNLPNQKETLNTIVKVNDYFMKKYKDYRTPSYVNNVVRPSNIWTRGVYYEGLMALYSIYLYGMAWGVRKGLLDRNEYLPVLLKAWNAMVKGCVHPKFLRLCARHR